MDGLLLQRLDDDIRQKIVIWSLSPDLKEALFKAMRFRLVRWLLTRIAQTGYVWHLRIQHNELSALEALLRIIRPMWLLNSTTVAPELLETVQETQKRCLAAQGTPPVLAAYWKSYEARRLRRETSGFGMENQLRLRFPRANDFPQRQGDLMILKPPGPGGEKGVLIVTYNEAIRRFAAVYDLEALADHYRFILEPSFSGYHDTTFFLFLGLSTDVVVEAQYHEDFRVIADIGGNLRPIRIGAGDWSDPDTFRAGKADEKEYDVIMIASWLKLKRHQLLFEALSQIQQHLTKVMLIGYPMGGRTREDIEREASRCGVEHLLEIQEKIPHSKVADLLRKSKVSVMLSKREGANRAIYEALFSNVPVILTDQNIGVNREVITSDTGIIARDDELAEKMLEVVSNHWRFRPRSWALANTGCQRSSEKLNDTIKKLALAAEEPWTRDIFTKKNAPHLMYVREEERLVADQFVTELRQFLR